MFKLFATVFMTIYFISIAILISSALLKGTPIPIPGALPNGAQPHTPQPYTAEKMQHGSWSTGGHDSTYTYECSGLPGSTDC